MSQPSTSYKVGEHVSGEVTRIYSNRIFVRLANGTSGFVRPWEMSWESEKPDPASLVSAGQSVDAVVISLAGEGKGIELSLRFAEHDPWVECEESCKIGAIVEGKIKNVRDFGAFVEIFPGLIGLIPRSEILLYDRVEQAQDELWAGDLVRAMIIDFKPEVRQLSLSIKEYLKSRPSISSGNMRQEASMVEFLNPVMQRKIKQLLGDIPEPIVAPEPENILDILIVDDYEQFRVSLRDLLQEWAYNVVDADDLNVAEEKIKERRFDLILLDLSLSGGLSLDFARKTKALYPRTHILLLSGVDVQVHLLKDAEESGIPLEFKPFGADALAGYLNELEKGNVILGTNHTINMSSKSPISSYTDQDLKELMEVFVDNTDADSCVLFYESKSKQGEINWSTQCGVELRESPEIHTMLRYSPVGDAFRRGEVIVIEDVQENLKQSEYLLDAVEFRSCVGYPIFSPARRQMVVLFLFSNNSSQFTGNDLSSEDYIHFETFLFRQDVFSELLKTQSEVLRSRLRAGALHDISNSLGGMDFKLVRLLDRLQELENDYDATIIAQAGNIANEIQAVAAQMGDTLKVFRELGRAVETSNVDVNALVRRSIERLKPTAHDLNVSLDFEPSSDIPMLNIPSTHLQQVLDNVILNAIQWCAHLRTRNVSVVTEYSKENKEFPVQIRIMDTGRGIHASLQREKIFELGYTLRDTGAGLGLFVAQSLLSALSGKIEVEKSILEVGSTFLISLPMIKK